MYLIYFLLVGGAFLIALVRDIHKNAENTNQDEITQNTEEKI